MMRVLRRPTFATGSSLLTSLVSYWKLDEASGDALDAHGSNNLTDTNTVTSTTGKINNARVFASANSEKFTLADNASLSTGNIDFTWSGWLYLTAINGYPGVISKDNGTFTEYAIYNDDPSDSMVFYVGDGGSDGSVTATTHGVVDLNAWMLLIAWHDATANTLNIQIDNGTVDSVAHTTGVLDTAYAFNMGAGWNGRIDEVGFWKRVLTTDERSILYNAGAGTAYPF